MTTYAMNDMKKLIAAYLRKTDEATAKQIALSIGCRESQGRVNNALNALRTYGTVECEIRKEKGNELIYWLSSAAHEDEAMPEADSGLLDIVIMRNTWNNCGESHHRARLSDVQVREMRRIYYEWKWNGIKKGYATLADIFGCGKSTARDIVTYRRRREAA